MNGSHCYMCAPVFICLYVMHMYLICDDQLLVAVYLCYTDKHYYVFNIKNIEGILNCKLNCAVSK